MVQFVTGSDTIYVFWLKNWARYSIINHNNTRRPLCCEGSGFLVEKAVYFLTLEVLFILLLLLFAM